MKRTCGAAGVLGLALALLSGHPGLAGQQKMLVQSQVSGPFKTISYLVVDADTGQAAIIDPGPAIPELLSRLDSGGLRLKYILLTHAHQDHIAGLAALKAKHPEAMACFSILEYEDFTKYRNWRTLFDAKSAAAWEKNPAMRALMDIPYGGGPDLGLADGQTLPLGGLVLKVWETPGHSRGSLTFSVGEALFPGDLILYHETGYLDYPLASREALTASICRLYASFDDRTVIYPGHGDRSTIGYEKIHNRNVKATAVIWDTDPVKPGQ
jgi:hydroxyacylglutathione hydrolase